MLGNIWELKDDRENLIENLFPEGNVFKAEMLRVVCKKFKRKLDLSDEKVEIIADNQEELEQQRIVLDIKEQKNDTNKINFQSLELL